MSNDDNLMKKNQIVDGKNILTDIEYQTIWDFINSGGGGNVDLSAYALRTNTVDKTTNQSVDGIKTFVKSPVVPDPANDNQAMNKGSLAPILATYPFLKGRGTFGTGASDTGGDLPSPVEDFAVYVNISTNVDGFYSPLADNIYDEGDFAIGMNGQWLRISGGEGVVKINGFKTREVNLKFSDLVDTEVMSLAHTGKVLGVVTVNVSDGAGGFIDVPRITYVDGGTGGGGGSMDLEYIPVTHTKVTGNGAMGARTITLASLTGGTGFDATKIRKVFLFAKATNHIGTDGNSEHIIQATYPNGAYQTILGTGTVSGGGGDDDDSAVEGIIEIPINANQVSFDLKSTVVSASTEKWEYQVIGVQQTDTSYIGGRTVLHEVDVTFAQEINEVEIPYNHAEWEEYDELLLLGIDILGDDRINDSDAAYRIGWGFKNSSDALLIIKNYTADGLYTTTNTTLSNQGGKTTSIGLRMANKGDRLGMQHHLNALVETVNASNVITQTSSAQNNNPKVATNGASMNDIGSSNYNTFLDAPAADIAKIIFKMSEFKVADVGVFKGKLQIVGIKS